MNKQQKEHNDVLKDTFSLPFFQDEVGESEYIDKHNYFLIVYGSFRSTDSIRHVTQEIYVVYVTEDNPEVETTTLDILTTVSNVRGFVFDRSMKDRLQKKETDDYVDQVTLVFRRQIAYECPI